jgi:hypothetical protein
MPWATNCHCPKCHFTFGFDAELERLVDDKSINKKYMDLFFKIRLISLPCPKCSFLLVHDFTTFHTFAFEEVMKVLNGEKPDGMRKNDYQNLQKRFLESHLSIKNLKLYLSILKNLIQNRLEIGRSVIPEKLQVDIAYFIREYQQQSFTFEEFFKKVD